MSFRTIEWRDNAVIMIDQTRLPEEEVYNTYEDFKSVAEAIKGMIIRGAPAIGVAAAMGIALGAREIIADTHESFFRQLENVCEVMARTRPTAVNLFWAIERMKRVAEASRGKTLDQIREVLKKEAIRIEEEDLTICRNIGKWGATLIPQEATILTHCNAGGLATAGYGTALGVIRAAHEAGKAIKVFADETRPWLQGARLTAWELVKEGIPSHPDLRQHGRFFHEPRRDYLLRGGGRPDRRQRRHGQQDRHLFGGRAGQRKQYPFLCGRADLNPGPLPERRQPDPH